MCIYVDDDYVTHLDDGSRRARTQHACKECSRTIEPGETYRYWTYVDHEFGNGPQTDKMCAHCWDTIELGVAFTGCPAAWYWGEIHRLTYEAMEDGSFVANIIHDDGHDLTVGQKRAMVRCVRGARRQWRDRHGALLPLVSASASAKNQAVRDAVNAALHGRAKPCQHGCTHVIVGRWTALGIANVIARADLEDSRG